MSPSENAGAGSGAAADGEAAPGVEPAAGEAGVAPARSKRPQAGVGTLIAFTATTFLSAMLLFSVQPMFAKMVLPLLGGAPSVWAVALLFFQAALLAGYGYAHLLVERVPLRLMFLVHGTLMLLALLVLPIGIPAGWSEPPPGDAYFWQLGLFTVAIGLPFVAVAANAPLLQAWFARSGHPLHRDPYFLYAASNLGSLIALLGYPLAFEPAFGLRALAGFWTIGFWWLFGLLALCFFLVRYTGAASSQPLRGVGPAPAAAAPGWRERARWAGLAMVPSALLTAFTTHVATDVASAPLIWVIPLSLYLLTFVIVFRERALIPWPVLLTAHLIAVALALLQLAQMRHEKWPLTATVGVAAFFISALVAHRTLFEARPAARYLTDFYMWMSAGGVLGGVFAALIAPRVFSEVFEYPLLLALTFACRPGALDLKRRDPKELAWLGLMVAAGIAAIYGLPWIGNKLDWSFDDWGATPVLVLGFTVAALAAWHHPTRQLAAALLMYLAVVLLPSQVHRGQAQRSYFGVYRVVQSSDGQFNVLQHGTTLHGAQRIRDGSRRPVVNTTPATYYHPHSPMAYAVRIIGTRLARTAGQEGRYGVIGLGAGSMACHSASGERWRFFEIDPVVVGIAKGPHFSYLANCQPKADIVLGDARLTFAREQDESFDLLIVDAFSSDAIPMHMLTAEAIALYAAKLKPLGIGVLHISNRYLDLESVLAATIPKVPGLHALTIEDTTADDGYVVTGSTVVVFGKSMEAIDPLRAVPGARNIAAASELRPWTDDSSDVLGPFVSQLRKRRVLGPAAEAAVVAPQ